MPAIRYPFLERVEPCKWLTVMLDRLFSNEFTIRLALNGLTARIVVSSPAVTLTDSEDDRQAGLLPVFYFPCGIPRIPRF